MRIVGLAETIDALSVAEAASVIERTYAALASGQAVASSPSAMRIMTAPRRIQIKGAVLHHEGIAGARLSSAVDPRLMLWRIDSGEPLLLLEESWLYAFRTGVSGAVVARWLSPSQRPRIALIGAGKIATHMARAFAQLCNPTSLRVVGRSAGSAQRLVDAVASEGVDIAAAASIEEAVHDADVVATITTASAPLVQPHWVRSGALVLSMGGAQEFDVRTWHQAVHRFVDDLDYALYQGDVAAWCKAGELDAQAASAQALSIGSVAAGQWTGRRHAQESVYAAIQGLTALDLALAYQLYSRLQPA